MAAATGIPPSELLEDSAMLSTIVEVLHDRARAEGRR